jgi:hypothetical protein
VPPEQEEAKRRIWRHPVGEPRRRGLGLEFLREQQLVNAEFPSDRHLEQLEQAQQGHDEGAHRRDAAQPRADSLLLQQPRRRARQDEAHGRDGVHGHQAGQYPLEDSGIEQPAGENHATHEYGQDACHPRESPQEANKP